MNAIQLKHMHEGKGFIAALDQSGGSTPKALQLYGIEADRYQSEEEMLDFVHKMRARIMTSTAFSNKAILGAILFENTLLRDVAGVPTATYLWEKKKIVPFLKIDNGLEEEKDGVQLMKAMPDLKSRLQLAVEKDVFGTKMRSVIKAPHTKAIAEAVEQQFDTAKQIISAGLVPIIEPEVDLFSPGQDEPERILLQEVKQHLAKLSPSDHVIFKFSLPAQANFYKELLADSHVVRIMALSGGYSQEKANAELAKNNGLIASFSRALTQGIREQQTDQEFEETLSSSIQSILTASLT